MFGTDHTTPGLHPVDIRRVIKIKDRRSGDDVYRVKTFKNIGIRWMACSNSIKKPFVKHDSKPPKPGEEEATPKPESPTVARPYYISFNNTFVAQVDTDKNSLTVDQIIAVGRALFGIGVTIPVFVTFSKPCTGRSY